MQPCLGRQKTQQRLLLEAKYLQNSTWCFRWLILNKAKLDEPWEGQHYYKKSRRFCGQGVLKQLEHTYVVAPCSFHYEIYALDDGEKI